MIPFFLNRVGNNRTTYNEALTHRGFSLDEEQCKQLIIKVFENYVLADREKEISLSIINYSALVIVILSASFVTGWIFNYMLTDKQSKSAPLPGTNIIESGNYSDCIPILLHKLNECKIEGIEKHKHLTEMMLAHQNNDFGIFGKCKCVKSEELDLPNISGDDDVFELTKSTNSQSECSKEDGTSHIACAAEKKHMLIRSSNVRVTKI